MVTLESNAKNNTVEKIIELIESFRKQVNYEPIGIRLTNCPQLCEGATQKIQLEIIYKMKGLRQIVSPCLSLDDVLAVHQALEKYCEKNNLQVC